MPLRLGGIVILLLGIALTAAGIAGITHGPSMAALANAMAHSRDSVPLDRATWLHHWRLWGIGIACCGATIAVAGAALALQKRWGFMLLAFVMALAATGPWIIQGVGLARYAFERPGSMETFVFVALSLPALWGYFRHSGHAPDA